MPTPDWIRRLGNTTNQNSTTILSGVAIAGVIVTAALAAKASVKAHKQVEGLELEPAEIAKNTWKLYIPAALAGAATIGCIAGVNQIGLRRHAAMVGAYTLVDTTFRQYKDAVLDQLGENKEQGIRDAVAQKQIEERPMTDSKVILMAGGDQLCLESLTGRYFKSTLESVRKAQNDLNERMLGGDYYASHDEFCELLGLGSTGFGTELGWNGANLVQLQFTAAVTDNGEAAIVIGYASMPRTNYTDF